MLVADLVPPPAVVRERLARAEREVEVLRAQLRLSIKAADGAAEHERAYRNEPAASRAAADSGP